MPRRHRYRILSSGANNICEVECKRCDKTTDAGALTDIEQAIQLTPTNPRPYISRGQNKGLHEMDFPGEQADYTKAIELDPFNG